GMPIPVVSTAMGRAAASLLPALEAVALQERLEAADAEQWSAYREAYHAGLAQCATRGFCTCVGEYMAAIHAVAVPLFHTPTRTFAL
ncbi:IclR family transcriptional regulator C-terminal domain-containing protein, partial [Acinetobacter baumannii]